MREGLKGKGGGIQLVTDIAGKALYMIETWLENASTRMTKAPSKSLSLATYIES
jgi:hypothetical protein